jgi:hypothetical protein
MPPLVAVPVEELPAVGAGMLDVVEPVGELGPVLQGLELRFLDAMEDDPRDSRRR